MSHHYTRHSALRSAGTLHQAPGAAAGTSEKNSLPRHYNDGDLWNFFFPSNMINGLLKCFHQTFSFQMVNSMAPDI